MNAITYGLRCCEGMSVKTFSRANDTPDRPTQRMPRKLGESADQRAISDEANGEDTPALCHADCKDARMGLSAARNDDEGGIFACRDGRLERAATQAGDQVDHALDVGICLLYTSDAADDLLCVDLGGR